MDTIVEIARQLHDVPGPGSRNSVSPDELKRWAIEYLDEYDDELARFPKLVGQAHWNLWMRDRSLPDAFFVVLIFSPNSLEFFCGTGDSFQLREFSEHEVFDDASTMSTAMKRRFLIPEPTLVIDRASAEEWLDRSW
ncbi:MAG TPA: hypothetical protein PLN21_14185 [Gemmatales bacterium]|nr:hypothetical protein [Gemmatales bacterium]